MPFCSVFSLLLLLLLLLLFKFKKKGFCLLVILVLNGLLEFDLNSKRFLWSWFVFRAFKLFEFELLLIPLLFPLLLIGLLMGLLIGLFWIWLKIFDALKFVANGLLLFYYF